MAQESGPSAEASTGAPTPGATNPLDARRALFAAAGERVYLIERYQAELNAIKAELDRVTGYTPPPQAAPPAEAPKQETAPAQS